ncbi:hypothetical protein DEO23_07170 [Brachybacterium endophyticum]|uniref:Uncharacterized protein n=1 Tax=Brachybacterium endophyticum TaxID=2182385 RepID=A0A2U2RLF8_9MICO|nr:hypothetical protein [Brachybacterium endophyticum]PWH06700.1 hypothetical protein DEO23_07170 [Brachybacterium endophyticum]
MDERRMHTVPSHTLSSARPEGPRAGDRPQLFAVIVTIALLCLLTVLLGGPLMPLASSTAMAAISVLLVTIGWVVAGPRRR